jgi:hypothetical protein
MVVLLSQARGFSTRLVLITPFPQGGSIVKILYINANGAGFADHIDIAEGTTVAALFEERLPAGKSSDYLIRVNRQPTSSDAVLEEGDRVSITPVKIEGAVTWEQCVRSIDGCRHE